MDRKREFKKIILITRTGSMTFSKVSIDDVLAMNEGYYEERYMLAKIDGDYRVIWNFESDKVQVMDLEVYLRKNAIKFTKQFGIESYNLFNAFIGGHKQRHTGKNVFIIPLDSGEEILIRENVQGDYKEYSTQSEYLDVEGNTKTFNHKFSTTRALFDYIDRVKGGE